jgi:sulfite exporter TauE/SafE
MLNGLLPCGLVISALVGAAGTTSAIGGALFMAVFGIGTLPVIASFAFGGGWLRQRLPSRFRLALPVLALFLGAAIVVRGMGLGVPYLSPKPPAIIEEAGCCSHPANR